MFLPEMRLVDLSDMDRPDLLPEFGPPPPVRGRRALYQPPYRATGIRVVFGARPRHQPRAHPGQPNGMPVLDTSVSQALGCPSLDRHAGAGLQ